MRILDVQDKESVQEIGALEDMDTFDVIPYYEKLFITGKTGIYLYDYAQNPAEPEPLAFLQAQENLDDDNEGDGDDEVPGMPEPVLNMD